MSDNREFNASTVDEAVERAASVLGIGRESLAYRVIDEGSSGFLGLGARDARIEIEAPSSTQDPPVSGAVAEGIEGAPTPEPAPESQLDGPAEVAASVTAEPTPDDESIEVSGELLSEVREHVETTLDAMGFESEVSASDSGEVILVDIESRDTGLLIGRKGETLDAIQYLVNVSVYRDRQFSKKIILDCGGYRDRRVKAVQGMALRVAKKVTREGKATDLPPMSSSERRAVHSYLKDNPQVTTSSGGNDENRKVTISPS